MSRIDEALRLSRTTEGFTLADRRPSNNTSFHSPWDFAHADATQEASERVPEPTLGGPEPGLYGDEARIEGGAVVSGFNSQWMQRLVVSPSTDAYFIEQFRRLAATLHQAQAAHGTKTVLMTSASPNDGKTLTAINLALTLSESYRRRVLLIDADLRRPSIRDVSHMPDVLGLADGLRSKTEQKLTVFRLTPNLSLLPAGRPDADPMGSLTSSRMSRVLADARSRFDWVVLDAPPVGTVSDASILAEMVDVALLVVRAGQTDCGLTLKAIESLGRERILGVVLNGADPSATYRDYYRAYEPIAAKKE